MVKKSKISLVGLILMIFTAIYGFGNVTIAYAQMGYASIIWYVFAAIIFFLPSGLMFAEYGSALKDDHGGFYSWLSESVGEKFAFVGTFIWLASWMVWMVSTSSRVWIPMSTMISGSDQTQTWSLFGLSSVQTIGLLGFFWIIVVTFFTTKGIDSIKRVGSIGGTFIMILTAIFLAASIILLFVNHGHFQEPIHGLASFTKSPSPAFQSPIAIFSFIVYAIFAYGGMESMGGIVENIDNSEKNFPRGIIISTILITVFYAISIFFWGVSANWHKVIGGDNVNLGNITYVLMNNLGFFLGDSLGWSHATSVMVGNSLARFTGLASFLGFVGSFFLMVYSPLKSFIMGSPKELWPEKMTKLNKHGMPAFAMWMQAILISAVVLLVSFGGSGAQKFYLILTDMGNISTTVPYLFLVGAFPFFKKRTDLNRPFVAFKSKFWTNTIVAIILAVLTLGIVFTAVEPILEHDYMTAFWTIIGPVFFGAVALILYSTQTKRAKKINSQNK
ncbi:glutamate/gamma-aminobutyrate family transporter YjeM [Lentilactobacillus kribbianus]|uniref:glutamate/gamma-aminobutyrate family transporter YjeM n=1 Tax=Lentilactobacillus kribbianus TaxID=2729622 RepID=UPI0015560233|nr:glutamate/gamma-aminobutyrate family transporter YjeM [Lentilactobacillus kribbianus]